MKKLFLTLAVAILAGCGGGGSDSDTNTSNVLSDFPGQYVSCDGDHIRTFLTIDADMRMKVVEKVYQFSDCSSTEKYPNGDSVPYGWADYVQPAVFTYTGTAEFKVQGYPAPGAQPTNDTSLTVGTMAWESEVKVTGKYASNGCITYPNTTYCPGEMHGTSSVGLKLVDRVLWTTVLVPNNGNPYYKVTSQFIRQ